MKTVRLLLLAAAFNASLLQSTQAGYHRWRGGNAYPYWSENSNWSSGGAPVPGESGVIHLDFTDSALDFDPSSDVDNLQADKLTIGGSVPYSIGSRTGGPITLKPQAAGDSINNTCPELTFYYPLILTGAHRVYSHAGTEMFLHNSNTGLGGLTFHGAGTTSLSGLAENFFTGTVTVLEGILNLNKEAGTAFKGDLVIGELGATLGAYVYVRRPGQIPNGRSVTVHSGAYLFVSDVDETIGPLTMTGGKVYGGNGGVGGNSRLILGGTVTVPATATEMPTMGGAIALGSVSRQFNVAAGASMTSYAELYSPNPNVGLVKKGGGVLTLYGDGLFTGATDVVAGRLRLTQNQQFSPVVIHPGAELTAFDASVAGITGTGCLLHITYIAGANYVVGCHSLHLSGNSTFRTDLHGPQAGTQFGQLVVQGQVTLDGCALDVVPTYNAPVGQKFLIIRNDSGYPVNGTFQNLPEGARAVFGDASWQITYHGGAGNDIVLTRKAGSASLHTIARQPDGAMLISGQGIPNAVYRKEASTDLLTWTDIGPVTATGAGDIQFSDADAVNHPRRFYRCPAQ